MNKYQTIIQFIDEYLRINHQNTTTPNEVNPYLEKKGILNDNSSRKGKPLRDILRKGLIPHAYQNGNRWVIPKSNTTVPKIIKSERSNLKKDLKRNNKGNKLEPIAELVSYILEKRYKEKPKYTFEYSPEWLKTIPNKNDFPKNWNTIKKVYSEINDNKLDFETQLEKIETRKKNRTQFFDIWFFEPYSFAVEFDEKQHFNQFRKLTLNYYINFKVDFSIKHYISLNGKTKTAGKSGFTKLKSNDLLFPELLQGENQDNRIRQRAFRDFLKDVTPVEFGHRPTLRIPYHITNKKIKEFNEYDLKMIFEYINEYSLMDYQ